MTRDASGLQKNIARIAITRQRYQRGWHDICYHERPVQTILIITAYAGPRTHICRRIPAPEPWQAGEPAPFDHHERGSNRTIKFNCPGTAEAGIG
jgi:hypothetical protein